MPFHYRKVMLGSAQGRYCAKVGLAAGLGYLLTQGNANQYAVYSAFTAALIVGASVGEDLATSVNRVKGTFAGMLAGMAVSYFFGPSAVAVGLAAGLTALLTLALGWGVQVARIGATLCIITLVFHDADPLRYDVLRGLNTLIGLAVGLAVSFLVWPVRARDELPRATQLVLEAIAGLLDAAAAGVRDLRPAEMKLYEAIGAVVKTARDGRLEWQVRGEPAVNDPRGLQILQLGFDALAAGLSAEGRGPERIAPASLQALRERLAQLRRP